MEHNGADSHDGRYPGPPVPTDVLISFHAGHLDPAFADHVREVTADDPDAQRILAALDATNADLVSLRDEEVPIPPDVRARMLDTISRFHTD
ncbi:hypothetical protein L5G28_02645 [Gordonia sp. HY285]|uniref:hypothetical protein n=1 Tax=Gordonia liuliyuniae TaxID=2911517 RepID=UPI001F28AAB9|nr:hypothetical protein [Gordonia liuliyuniae]MCF8609063.1 hypothetical protein [Gordonia liuliyuniae]